MPAPQRMSVPRRMNAPESSMFPHTVTIYNLTTEFDKTTFKDKSVNYITILRGVFLDAAKAANVRQSGLEGADSVNLIIPFGVEAVDGVTGETKEFMEAVGFWKLDPEEKAKYWTLAITDKDPDIEGMTFFIKGVAVEPDRTLGYLELQYDHVYDVTKVDEKDFGGLPHWEVGGV